ncbi:hypothetical protein KC717_04575 [Candidatus Dojkabacteria bacterium]|uniref:Virulence-associated protein E-like domain-containing protein n=1 Tax=Candidatus Dojkabacteria bacterium TaxID=2099670 RepID=A0A955L8E5_9BACT|nr:hypothetical protein [Candidatus Dojkabacteria bacterium]
MEATVSKNELVLSYIEDNYDVRRNVVSQKIEFKLKKESEFQNAEGGALDQIWYDINLNVINNYTLSKTRRMLSMKADVNEHHPFKYYFDSLPEWDTADHIGEVATMVTSKELSSEDWYSQFAKWIVGVVASAIDENINNNCLVLSGPAGIGKTTFFRNLVPVELKRYYKEERITAKEKIRLTNSFLIDVIDADYMPLKKRKAFRQLIKKTHFDIRLPHNKHETKLRRRASLCGTTNSVIDVSIFNVIEVTGIDYKKPINHEQMYAQAYWMLKNNFDYKN